MLELATLRYEVARLKGMSQADAERAALGVLDVLGPSLDISERAVARFKARLEAALRVRE